MGLDMYVYRRKNIKCPHCGELLPDPTSYSGEVCYWHGERWLFNYISTEVLPDGYGDDMYCEFVKLSLGDLQKIRRKIVSYYTKEAPKGERRYDIREHYNIKALDGLIKEMKKDPLVYAVYEADW